MDSSTAPVLIICFDRPEYGAKVIRSVWDSESDLYLFRDGGGSNEAKELYEALFREVKAFRDARNQKTFIRMEPENLGPCDGPFSAIQWFFQNNPHGIVLEEDVMPQRSMIETYSKALEEFKGEHSIFALASATTKNLEVPSPQWAKTPLFLVWGWASWADRILAAPFPNSDLTVSKKDLQRFGSLNARLYMSRELKIFEKNPKGCWSYHYQTHILQTKMDVLMPQVKFSQNIGIGKHARRTKDGEDESPNWLRCMDMAEQPPTIAPCDENWIKWQKAMEVAKFRGICHEIRNRLQIRTRIKNIFRFLTP